MFSRFFKFLIFIIRNSQGILSDYVYPAIEVVERIKTLIKTPADERDVRKVVGTLFDNDANAVDTQLTQLVEAATNLKICTPKGDTIEEQVLSIVAHIYKQPSGIKRAIYRELAAELVRISAAGSISALSRSQLDTLVQLAYSQQSTRAAAIANSESNTNNQQ
jgi:hypothetical protein